MNALSTYLTKQGYEKLEEELNHLRTVRRREIAGRLELALEEGPLLENAELEDARNEQAQPARNGPRTAVGCRNQFL